MQSGNVSNCLPVEVLKFGDMPELQDGTLQWRIQDLRLGGPTFLGIRFAPPPP